jgi:hypothetical protein
VQSRQGCLSKQLTRPRGRTFTSQLCTNTPNTAVSTRDIDCRSHATASTNECWACAHEPTISACSNRCVETQNKCHVASAAWKRCHKHYQHQNKPRSEPVILFCLTILKAETLPLEESISSVLCWHVWVRALCVDSRGRSASILPIQCC